MKNKNNIDWIILKSPLILLCLCLVIASVCISASYYFYSHQSKEYKNNKRFFQSISRRYLDVDQEEKILRDYYPQFINLYNQGIIGREKRLKWIEVLRKASQENNLLSLSYSINARKEYIPEYNINYNGYTLYNSSMELNLDLLHEGDFFKLLHYINRTETGFYTIAECKFRMYADEIRFEKNHANISASCLLYWITIEHSDALEIEIG